MFVVATFLAVAVPTTTVEILVCIGAAVAFPKVATKQLCFFLS
jgi:hypothetical protein